MKRFSILILTLVFVLASGVSVGASTYKSDLYSVNVPENYVQTEEGVFDSDDGSNFSISYEDNTELNFCVVDMTQSKMEKNAELLVQEGSAAFSALDKVGGIKLISVEKIKHPNGKSAIVTVLETFMETEKGKVTRYQKMYEFAGVKHKYVVVYTVDEKENLNDFDKVFDSIVIHEAEEKGMIGFAEDMLLLVGFVLVICLGIIRFMKKSDKSTYKKAKRKNK